MGRSEQLWSYWENPQVGDIACELEDFLRQLAGPSVIRLSGQDSSRCRVVVTLLHGNEPSGVKAIHKLLREGVEPAVDTLLVVVCVGTALQPPLFSHRFLPDRRDMNRCFKPPYEDYQGLLAKELIDRLVACRPEAIVDLHNTSGDGPAFSVTSFSDINNMSLASLFSPRLVYTNLSLGSLMELQDPGCPVVAVECGGARQQESDQVAYRGLTEFLMRTHLYKNAAEVQLDLYRNPMRLELKDGFTIDCAKALTEADVTLQKGIQQLNFGEIPIGQSFAWLGKSGLDALQLIDGNGENVVAHFFEQKVDVLYSRQPLKLFMVTEDPHIASTDCLFYVVAVDE